MKVKFIIEKMFAMSIILMVSEVPTLEAQLPKREFRAVWIATVENIDWPTRQGLSSEDQKGEIISILDHHKKNNINAIILQVRPSSDAIYESSYEPWSRYLGGKQGIPPDPFYDPLDFWIQECHRRGMELHAWFNPYRIKQNLKDSLVEDHVILKNPEWGWEYGNRLYFSPDNPEVWQYLSQVVGEVVRNYNVDAIHFDDYFYPYKIANLEIPDEEAFRKYGGKFYPDRKDDWRRHNVDTIIQILSQTIKSEKPWVKFGISPFGVWRNRSQDMIGSETGAGTTNFDVLYADVLKWQREGWIDYLMPQLYWQEGHPAADFSTLAYWWADYDYGRAIYVGLAPYKLEKKSEYKEWRKYKFFFKQIEVLRNLQSIDGYGFFSSKHFFREDLQRFDKRLQRKHMANISLVPPMPWINATAPLPPVNLRREGERIIWDTLDYEDEMNLGRFFVLYYSPENSEKFLKKAENILALTGERFVEFEQGIPNGIYRVSSLDRLNNESQLSDIFVIDEEKSTWKLFR